MNIEEQVLSREQMAHLKELGIDTSDASMAWFMSPKTNQWKIKVKNNFSHELLLRLSPERYIPTYTIGDLIEKLPKSIEGNCLVINYIYSEIIYKDILHYDFEGVGLMTTLYAVLCWVAENHIELIK